MGEVGPKAHRPRHGGRSVTPDSGRNGDGLATDRNLDGPRPRRTETRRALLDPGNGNTHIPGYVLARMGLGGTAKKIQRVAEKAEQTYEKLTELRKEVDDTQEMVSDTATRVQRLENEMAEQRAVLDAIAEEVGVDREDVSTDVHIAEAEQDESAPADEE